MRDSVFQFSTTTYAYVDLVMAVNDATTVSRLNVVFTVCRLFIGHTLLTDGRLIHCYLTDKSSI